MGREIRMVPPNWGHPMKDYPNYRTMRTEKSYKPLFDEDADSAYAEWLEEFEKWKGEPEDPEYPKSTPYASFCKWHGGPPDHETYRPKWPEGSATWVQVYETVTEGTPVTPPFATKEELINYLATYGDEWDQKRGDGAWDRNNAESFVNAGWVPSMIISGGKLYAPKDGFQNN